jgi:hypothetical protein
LSDHLQARRDSGQTQAAYCRTRGLDPKLFTLWKRKLRDERAAVGCIDSPGLVPVVVRSERATPAPTEASGMYGAAGELGETNMIPKEVLSL